MVPSHHGTKNKSYSEIHSAAPTGKGPILFYRHFRLVRFMLFIDFAFGVGKYQVYLFFFLNTEEHFSVLYTF